jgi:hypothetical protein
MNSNYLKSVVQQFEYYKLLGDKTFAQLSDEKLFWQFNEDSNSIATIVKHLWGNMISRWTDFLTSDGEKEWRNRDAEFENDITSKEEMMNKWNEGWKVFLDTLKALKEDDLEKIIYIRNQGHTVLEAINRQLAHYPYHIGQIVFIGKMCTQNWNSLSIAKGGSSDYNHEKFSKPKGMEHFTNEFLNQKKMKYSITFKYKIMINLIIRVLLTALLVSWAVIPYFDNSGNDSILNEVFTIGILPSALIIGAFFTMVGFYCLTLQRCMTLIKPENRKTKPTSVWYMFAIPFNFVEDFFIVINIANSLEAEKKSNDKLKNISDFGMISGIGWSIAQILSFIPNYVGQIAGLLGMILVIYHWLQIANINKTIADK